MNKIREVGLMVQVSLRETLGFFFRFGLRPYQPRLLRRDVEECLPRAAELLILAKYQAQITCKAYAFERDCLQHAGLLIVHDVQVRQQPNTKASNDLCGA